MAQINPFAAAALADLLPTAVNATRSNNLLATIPLRDYSDKYDAKLDYQIKSNMNMFLRFSQRKDISFFGPADPGLSGGDGNGFIRALQQQAAIGYTWSSFTYQLFEARSRFRSRAWRQTAAVARWATISSRLGIQGFWTCPQPGRWLPLPNDRDRIQQSYFWPTNDQSSVPESDLVEPEVQLFVGKGKALYQSRI